MWPLLTGFIVFLGNISPVLDDGYYGTLEDPIIICPVGYYCTNGKRLNFQY